MTIGLYAKRTCIQFINENGENNPDAAEELCDWIKHETAKKISVDKQDIDRTLDMHLCVIIDEAGDLDIKDWFEDKNMLMKLCNEAEKLATTVAVVVSGTALTGREMSSVDDAFFFPNESLESSRHQGDLEHKNGSFG